VRFAGCPRLQSPRRQVSAENLNGDASLSLSEPMARLGLLLAMALVAMAALFAQLPLASAAPCVTSLLPVADAASDATALTAPSAAAEAEALEAAVGLLAAVATVLARPRPAAEAEAEWAAAAAAQPRPAAARLPGACSCSRARVLAARSAAAQERPWTRLSARTQANHRRRRRRRVSCPLPAARNSAPALLRASLDSRGVACRVLSCAASDMFSISAQHRRHRRWRGVPWQLPRLLTNRRRRRRRCRRRRRKREQRAEPRQVAGQGPGPEAGPEQAAGAQAAGLSLSLLASALACFHAAQKRGKTSTVTTAALSPTRAESSPSAARLLPSVPRGGVMHDSHIAGEGA
jgi:hypothetical protein